MPPDRPLLMIVERFLRESDMAPTLFGRQSINDPRLVSDLRNGREPRTSVRCRVEHFMNIWRAEHSPRTEKAA